MVRDENGQSSTEERKKLFCSWTHNRLFEYSRKIKEEFGSDGTIEKTLEAEIDSYIEREARIEIPDTTTKENLNS